MNPSGWFENTEAGREKALAQLDGIVLEGATDLSAALEKLATPGFDIKEGTPLNVFLLSDGQITSGESEVGPLVARFEGRCPYPTRFHCYRVGIGAENQDLFAELTRKGGGVFNCYGEADVKAAAKAHCSQCLQIEKVHFVGGPAVSDMLTLGHKTAIYPDGELIVAARLKEPGKVTLVAGRHFPRQEIRGGSELRGEKQQ